MINKQRNFISTAGLCFYWIEMFFDNFRLSILPSNVKRIYCNNQNDLSLDGLFL